MTEELGRELEEIAGSVPAMPNDYAYLRSLIQSLPSPLSPELRSASGSPAAGDLSSTAASMAASMIGGAPGTESGAAIGSASELYYGNSNLLANPLWDSASYTGVALTAAYQQVATYWEARYELYSGNAPVNANVGLNYHRLSAANRFNSNMLYLNGKGAATGSTSYAILLRPSAWQAFDGDQSLPFLTASCKVTLNGWNINLTNTQVLRARMEIRRGTSDQSLMAAGEWLDFRLINLDVTAYRLSVAFPKPAGWTWDSYDFRWQLRLEVARTTSGSDYIDIGEPVLALSASQQPPPYSPILGKLESLQYLAARGSGIVGSYDQIHVGMSGWGGGEIPVIRMGAGGTTAWDVALTHPEFGALKLASLNASYDDSLYLGDDVILFDPDVADRLGIKGQATPANGGILLGSGKDTNLYRDSANVLKTDDSLVVAGTLLAQPSTAQTLAASSAIVANANIVQINSAGNVTITAAPTIANGVDGQLVTVVNVDTADTITLQDQGTLASSNLRLTATTVALAPRQSIQLMYSSTIGDWIQIGNKVAVL